MKLYFLTLWVVFFLVIGGCVTPPSKSSDSTLQTLNPASQREQPYQVINGNDAVKIPYSVKNYYSPLEVGFEKDYKITLTDVNSLTRRLTLAPNGNNIDVYHSQGMLTRPDNLNNYYLKIKVKSIEKHPSYFFQYSKGYQDLFNTFTDFAELEIIQDDVDIFEHKFAQSKKVYWGRIYDDNNPDSLVVNQIVFFSNKFSQSPNSGDSFSIRTIFTTNEPAQNASGAEDTLSLVGVDNNLSGYDGLPCIHFLRTVKPSDNTELGKSFTEDTWYAPGIGLVRLEQKVEGKISMTWDLDNIVR